MLVAMLQEHIKEFGTAKDGRLFANESGGVPGTSGYWRVSDQVGSSAGYGSRPCSRYEATAASESTRLTGQGH